MKTHHRLLFLLVLLALGCRAASGLMPASPPGATATPGAVAPLPTEAFASETASGAGDWRTYTSTELIYAFEYPAVYAEPAYAGCTPRSDGAGGTLLGQRSTLSLASAGGLAPGVFLDRVLEEKGFTQERREDTTVAGLPAVTIDYRFGGTNRFGALTAFERAGQMYVFNFTAGGTCDAPERGVTEAAAYARLIESFRFLEVGTPPTTPGPVVTNAPLYPPDADTPAAGICDAWPEEIVPVDIVLDVPSPRCLVIGPDQQAEFTNQTGAAVHVQLGWYEFDLQPGESYQFEAPFGEFLAVGVHHLKVSAGSVPELWLAPHSSP